MLKKFNSEAFFNRADASEHSPKFHIPITQMFANTSGATKIKVERHWPWCGFIILHTYLILHLILCQNARI